VEYGDYTINHIEGCAHGCRYPCYAMLMSKRFGRIKTYSDWLEPKLVSNALDLLNKELPKLKSKINYVHLCFMSDPFMYRIPEVSKLTLNIINLINQYGLKVTTLTKGKYPSNLLDYGFHSGNEYGVSLVSTKKSFFDYYEPNTYNWKFRVKQLKKLSQLGAKTWVSMEPYPTPNICNQSLLELLDQISFTDKIIFGRLNYNSQVSKYNYAKSFYNDCVQQVIEFCDFFKIEYHIKDGTYNYPSKCNYIQPIIKIRRKQTLRS